MTWKLSLKKHYSSLLYRTGVISALQSFHAKKNIILGYHRVLPQGSDELKYLQPGMYVTTDTFEKHMEYIARHYKVCSLSETSSFNAIRGACFVTFDDGWADTYEHAFPILKKYNIPATVFISTNFMGTAVVLWSQRVSIYVHNASETQLKDIMDILEDYSDETRKRVMRRALSMPDKSQFLEMAIGIIKGLDEVTTECVLNALDDCMGGIDKYVSVRRQWLTWDEIFVLASENISFGSHTHNHKILTKLGDDEIIAELEGSRKMLSEKLGREADLFSYPNGNYNEQVMSVLKKSGFRFGFTTRAGFVSNSGSPFTLGRILMHEDVTSTIPLFAGKLTRCVP